MQLSKFWTQSTRLLAVFAGTLLLGFAAFGCVEGVDDEDDDHDSQTGAAHVTPYLYDDARGDTCRDAGIALAEANDVPWTVEEAEAWLDCKVDLNADTGELILDEPGDFDTNPEECAQYLDILMDIYTVNDRQFFDWKQRDATPITAVLAKGGPDANLYYYDPPEFKDTELHAPVNPGGQWADLSHVSFCIGEPVVEPPEPKVLDVEKDAETMFERDHKWNIDKKVTPKKWSIFDGDSGTSKYTVKVDTTDRVDSEFAVSGTITIDNNTDAPAMIADVIDEVNDYPAEVDCPEVEDFPYTLAAGATLTCTYFAELPDDADRTNTVTVEVTPESEVEGASATADVEFDEPSDDKKKKVTVVDDKQGKLGTCKAKKAPCKFKFSKKFSCPDDEGVHKNTAKIKKTGKKDSAKVKVACHPVDVLKEAPRTTLDQEFIWDVQKTADPDEIWANDKKQTVEYTVDVGLADTDGTAGLYRLTGDIFIGNPNPTLPALINDVTDLVTPAFGEPVPMDVTCIDAERETVSFPYELAPGAQLECEYAGVFAENPCPKDKTKDKETCVNVASVELQNHAYDFDTSSVQTDTTIFSSDPVPFFFVVDDADGLIDECVDVTDTNPEFRDKYGSPTVCAGDAPAQFTYTKDFTLSKYLSEAECADFKHINTATATGQTTMTKWSDDAKVTCAGVKKPPEKK